MRNLICQYEMKVHTYCALCLHVYSLQSVSLTVVGSWNVTRVGQPA